MHILFRAFISPVFIAGMALLLPGCGGGGGTTTAVSPSKTISVTLTDVLNNPVANVLVQLDQNGATATTNASGIATFSGIATGAHDIHMFPAAGSGFQWESIYQTTAGTVQWVMSKNESSYVEFTGTLSNYAGTTLQLLLEDATYGQGFQKYCTVTGASYTCSVQADGIPTGSSGSFNLWALEHNAAGDVTDAVKLRDKSTYTVTTTAQGGTAVTQNITFNAVKPATSNLLTVDTVTPPAGVTVQHISGFMPVPLTGAFMGSTAAFGTPIVAYDPFPSGSGAWTFLDDAVGSTVTWGRFIKSTPGASIAASTSSITSLPVIAPQIATGQSNYKITFTPANGISTYHQLTIQNSTATKTLWNISLLSSATSATLPTIPASVTAILTSGASYKMQLAGAEIGTVNYEQVIAGQYDPTYLSYSDIEVVYSSTVNLTR